VACVAVAQRAPGAAVLGGSDADARRAAAGAALAQRHVLPRAPPCAGDARAARRPGGGGRHRAGARAGRRASGGRPRRRRRATADGGGPGAARLWRAPLRLAQRPGAVHVCGPFAGGAAFSGIAEGRLPPERGGRHRRRRRRRRRRSRAHAPVAGRRADAAVHLLRWAGSRHVPSLRVPWRRGWRTGSVGCRHLGQAHRPAPCQSFGGARRRPRHPAGPALGRARAHCAAARRRAGGGAVPPRQPRVSRAAGGAD